MEKINAVITGVGGYVPDYVLTNEELSRMVDTNDEWIMTRIGVKERRILNEEGLGTSYLARKAAKQLMQKTNSDPDSIDCVIVATTTPDYHFPSTASILCDKLGLKNAYAFDLQAACSGFLYAMETAASMIQSGRHKKIIIVGADKMSSMVNYSDRATCPIFIYVCNLGVNGAALATLISQFFSFCFVIFILLKITNIKLTFNKLDLKICKKIIQLGFSPFVIMSTDSVIFICLNTCIKNFGGDKADFYIEIATIVQAYFSLITGPLLGISTGTQPLLAYNYGAKNIELIKKAEKQLIIFALIFCSICFGLSFFTGKPFAKLFISLASSNPNNEVIDCAGKVISIYMYGIIPLAFQYVCVDGLTGLGQAKYSIWLSLNRKLVLMLPLTILLPLLTKNAFNVFYAEMIADIISSFVSLICFLIIFPKIINKRKNETKSVLE